METQTTKKVLFLITKSNWGGAQRYVFDLATHLPEGYEVVVALGGQGVLVDKLTAANIRVIHIPGLQRDVSFNKEIASFWQISKIIRAERPDILHVNSSKAGGIGAFLGRLHRVPKVIYTAHGWAFNENRSTTSKFIVGFFHWLTIMFAHQTITVSDALKKQMNWWWTKKKMHTITLGRSPIDFKSKDDARGILEMRVTEKNTGLTEFHDDIWIGTIAELHPIKRYDVAIASIAVLVHAFPRLRYVIIGDGQAKAEIDQQITALGLESHVFLLGAIEEAARFLKAFDLFLLTSQSEAAGYVLLEAGQAEVPIVATKVGGIPEFITNQESGLLVPVGDVEATVKALSKMLYNPTLRAEYAATMKMFSDAQTIEKMIDKTLTCYSSTIDNLPG